MTIQNRHSSKVYWLAMVAAVVFTTVLVACLALYSYTQNILFLIPAAVAACPTAFLCVWLDQIDNAWMRKHLDKQAQSTEEAR